MAYVSSLWATIVARLDSRRGGSGETIIKVKHRRPLLAAAALSLAFVMAPVPGAQAGTIKVTGTGAGGGITTDGGPFGFAGEINTNLNTGTQILNGFIAFCLDPFLTISVGPTYTATVTTDGTIRGAAVPNAVRVAWLMQTYAAGVNTPEEGKALQAAIWNLVADVNLSNTDSAYNLYQTYLDKSVGKTGSLARLFWITTGSASQGLIGIIPEPGSLTLLGLGLMGLGLSRRRKAA